MNGILSQKWAINYDYAQRALALYLRSLDTGHNLIRKQSLEDLSKPYASVSWDEQTGVAFAEGRSGRVAVIPIVGPLTKYGDLCSIGMRDYGAAIQRVNANHDYEGVVLAMDTPGGTVDGTPELAFIIASSTKPVVVFADGVVASAGVWLASQADYIVANRNNPTELGSIGVLLALPNVQNMVAAGNHPAIEIFRATKSVNKARLNVVETPDETTREYIQQSLDDTNSDFIQAVKAGRGDRLDTKASGLFDGTMFSAKEAKTIGLIDSIGTLQDAIGKVSSLARGGRVKASASHSAHVAALNTIESSNERDEMKLIDQLASALASLKAALVQPAPEATETTETEQQPAAEPVTDPVETPEAPTEESVQQEVASIQAEIDSIRSTALTTIEELRAQNTALSEQVESLRADLAKFQTNGAPVAGEPQFRTESDTKGNRVKEWQEKQKQKTKA